MVLSSSQVSGLVGGQQVMFSNYAAHSQQIGNLYGTGPQVGVQPLQNPYPGGDVFNSPGGAGTSIVGGMGMALPGMAATASMMGGLIGGPASVLDPWTMGATAFRAGTGAARGAGVMGTLGGIGTRFATQGLAGGLGAIGGGLAAAGAAALPYWLAGQAIETVGQNIYQGVQNVAQVGGIMGRQGPFYGQAGARPGGGMARSQVRDIVGTLEEFAGQDVDVSMREVMRLTDVAQRTGMLSGVMNAQQFKARFKKILSQAKDIAEVLGTTIEEAAPLLQQGRQMGLWRASDIMGMTQAIKTVGPQGAQQLMGAMQQGAQMSHAMGGAMAAGATMGRNVFMNIQAATQAGILPEEAITEFTGGVGGARGQQMIAQRLTGTMSRFSETSMGRLMMAGLAETEGGRFTGKIDKGRLEGFMRGDIGIGALQQRGQRASATRQGAASFTYRSGQIGQELMASGGMEAMAQAVRSVVERSGYGEAGEEIQGTFIQQLLGVDQREAEMWRRMGEELPRIMDQRLARQKAAIDDSMRQLREKRYRSFEGMKRATEHAWEQTTRPIREAAVNVSTKISQDIDSLIDRFYGREAPINVTAAEATSFRRQGFGAGAAALQRIGARPQYGTAIGERFVRSAETSGGLFGLTSNWNLAGIALGTTGTRTGDVLSAGVRQREALPGEETVTLGANALGGGGVMVRRQDFDFAQRRIAMRARNPSLKGLGYNVSEEESTAKTNTLSRAYTKFMTKNYLKIKELRDEVGSDEGEYQKRLRAMMTKDPEFTSAARELLEGKGDKEVTFDQMMLDAMAIGQKESGMGGPTGVDFKRFAERTGAMLPTFETEQEISAWVREGAEESSKLLRSTNYGKMIGGAIGLGLGPLSVVGAYLGSTAGSWIDELVSDDMSAKDLEEAWSNSEWGTAAAQWVKEGAGDSKDINSNPFLKAALGKNPDPRARKLYEAVKKLQAKNPDAIAKLGQNAMRAVVGKQAATSLRDREMLKSMAGQELSRLEKYRGKGLGERLTEKYKGILTSWKEAAETGDAKAEESARQSTLELARAVAGDRTKMAELQRMGGAVAGQVSGLAMIEQLAGKGEVSSAAATRSIKGISRALGYDIMGTMSKEDRAAIEKAMEGGGIDITEMRGVTERLRETASKVGPQQSRAAQQTHQEKLMGLLTSYAGAHQKFVWAVGANVARMQGEGEKMTNKLNEIQSQMNPAMPKGAGQGQGEAKS